MDCQGPGCTPLAVVHGVEDGAAGDSANGFLTCMPLLLSVVCLRSPTCICYLLAVVFTCDALDRRAAKPLYVVSNYLVVAKQSPGRITIHIKPRCGA